MSLDAQLLSILACPVCRGRLVQPDEEHLTCQDCGRTYPVQNGIPVLLAEEAKMPYATGQVSTPNAGPENN